MYFVLFEDYVQEKVAILNNVRINDRDGQRGVRAFTNSLTPVEADTQGRLVIPSELITYANIKKRCNYLRFRFKNRSLG